MFDCVLAGGLLIDGSGAPPRCADIALQNGLIAKVEDMSAGLSAHAAHVLQLNGAVVAPGFIDIHRHADAALFRPGFGVAELAQGITTIVNGNCGLSVAPLPAARRGQMLAYLAPIIGSLPQNVCFENYAQYVRAVRRHPLPLHVGMLVGSGTLRMASAGFGAGALPRQSLAALHRQLACAIEAGALGVSAGLAYVPDSYYTAAQLAEALAPMAGSGLPLVTHVRGEGDLLYGAVQEVLQVAKQLAVPLHISHFKCIGRQNWGHLLRKTIALLTAARQEGVQVHCDVYPWTAGSTQLVSLLPPAFIEGGLAETTRLLQNPARRAACRAALGQPGTNFENIVHSIGWDAVVISGVQSARNQQHVGKSIGQLAHELLKDPYDTAFDLLIEEQCNVSMIDYITCEEDIETILQLPFSSIISDTIYPDTGLGHPRGWANTARVFSHYVKQRTALTLEQAVHKLSGAPAAALGLRGKGLLREGYDADIVVFHPNKVHSAASYTNPQCPVQGIESVWVAGRLATLNGRFTGAYNGRFLSRHT